MLVGWLLIWVEIGSGLDWKNSQQQNLFSHSERNSCLPFLPHSDRKPTILAPSCRRQPFVWDQGWRARSTCPFVTSFPWCTRTISSLMVWRVAKRKKSLFSLCNTKAFACGPWTVCLRLGSRYLTPGSPKSKDRDVLLLGVLIESNLLLNMERISTGNPFFWRCLSPLCGKSVDSEGSGSVLLALENVLFRESRAFLSAFVPPGWDISSLDLGSAMERAQVFDWNLQEQLQPYMRCMKPRPSIYIPEFIAANQESRADNVLTGTMAEQVIPELRTEDSTLFERTVSYVLFNVTQPSSRWSRSEPTSETSVSQAVWTRWLFCGPPTRSVSAMLYQGSTTAPRTC